MIRLITGATRVNSRVLRPSDGAFSVDKATEEYLVRQGVAVYVTNSSAEAPVEIPEAPVIPDGAEGDADAPTIEADAPKKPKSRKTHA